MSDSDDIGTLSFWFKSNKRGLYSFGYEKIQKLNYVTLYPIGWDYTYDTDDSAIFFHYSIENIWQSISCNIFLSEFESFRIDEIRYGHTNESKEIEIKIANESLEKYGKKNEI